MTTIRINSMAAEVVKSVHGVPTKRDKDRTPEIATRRMLRREESSSQKATI